MSLTNKLFHILFPQNVFLGANLGDLSSKLAEDVIWTGEGDLAAEGALQRTWPASEDGFLGGRATLNFSMGLLCHAEAALLVDDHTLTMNEVGSGFASGLDKIATPHGDRVQKKRRYLASWDWNVGPISGILSLEVHPLEDSHAIAAEVQLELAPGAKLPRNLAINVEQLAKLLATDELPEAEVLNALNAFYDWPDVFVAFSQEQAAAATLARAWDLTAASYSNLREPIRRLFTLIDWESLSLSGMLTVPHLIFWHAIAASPLMSPDSPGAWIQLRLTDLLTLVALTGAPASERAKVAYQVVCAVQYGDAIAFNALAQRIAAYRRINNMQPNLDFGSSPEIDARAFALVTAGLDDTDRLRFAAQGDDDDRRYAAVLWCVGTYNMEIPEIQLPEEEMPNQGTIEAWATFLSLVKLARPDMFFELLGRALINGERPLCEVSPGNLERVLGVVVPE